MCVYCGRTEHSSIQCRNRRISPEATRDQEFQCTNSKISGKAGFQSTNNQRTVSQPHTHRSYSEISGSTGSYQPNNHNSQFSRGNQNHSSRHPAREQNCYDNNSSSSFRNYEHQLRLPTQSHARFDERYNQQYSPPIYPLTPSLNSSFPEALSKSLLQIAENQSRTIEAMKASQEAKAEAYKEMSRTNKMRDDDALFSSMMDPTPPSLRNGSIALTRPSVLQVGT